MEKTAIHSADYTSTMTSLAQSMYGALQYTEQKNLSLVDVMGLTSHAFRIRLDSKTDIIGPTAHVWAPFFRSVFANLGFQAVCFDPILHPIPLEHVETALRHIHDSLDRGILAISFGLLEGDFCLVYGYDDDQELLHVRDCNNDGTVHYEKLGAGKILTLTVDSYANISYTESLRRGLAMILAHGAYWEEGIRGYSSGLAAYDTWITALEQRTADPLGNAYNAWFVYDARRFASRFLHNTADKLGTGKLVQDLPHGYASSGKFLAEMCVKAAHQYDAVEESLSELCELFPFPGFVDPTDAVLVAQAGACLRRAKEQESLGLKWLARLYYNL